MTGDLRKEVLDALLETLPLEISFVDENDTVRYFNRGMISKLQFQDR